MPQQPPTTYAPSFAQFRAIFAYSLADMISEFKWCIASTSLVEIDKSISLNVDEFAKIPNFGALASSLIELLATSAWEQFISVHSTLACIEKSTAFETASVLGSWFGWCPLLVQLSQTLSEKALATLDALLPSKIEDILSHKIMSTLPL